MKLISCNQEMGDAERLLCPGAPQGPAWYHNSVNLRELMNLPDFLFPQLSNGHSNTKLLGWI